MFSKYYKRHIKHLGNILDVGPPLKNLNLCHNIESMNNPDRQADRKKHSAKKSNEYQITPNNDDDNKIHSVGNYINTQKLI